jgi:hypothetical protein
MPFKSEIKRGFKWVLRAYTLFPQKRPRLSIQALGLILAGYYYGSDDQAVELDDNAQIFKLT